MKKKAFSNFKIAALVICVISSLSCKDRDMIDHMGDKKVLSQTSYVHNNSQSQGIESNIVNVANEKSSYDPVDFALLARKHEMIYTEAVKNFSPNDLPKMYLLLDQDKYKDVWRFIAQLIGFVSNRGDKGSIDVLVNYLKRSDVWPEVKQDRIKSFDVGMGKILCLEWIGMIGGEYSEKILLKATIQEGAEEIAKEWLQFTEDSFPGGRDRAIASIRGRALLGLIYCQSQKGIEILERMYKDEREKCIQKGEKFSDMFNETVTAMAYKSLIDEHGLYRAFELYGNDGRIEIISQYVKKYWLISNVQPKEK